MDLKQGEVLGLSFVSYVRFSFRWTLVSFSVRLAVAIPQPAPIGLVACAHWPNSSVIAMDFHWTKTVCSGATPRLERSNVFVFQVVAQVLHVASTNRSTECVLHVQARFPTAMALERNAFSAMQK